MALLKQTVAVAAVLLMALTWVGGALHEHDAGVQSSGHANCAVCHYSHLSAVETNGAPAPSRPDLVAHAVASTHPDGELSAALGIHSPRAPPA